MATVRQAQPRIWAPKRLLHAEHEVEIALATNEVLNGTLPPPALALVVEWAQRHSPELAANWEAARRGEPLS